ncbi:uncharacterized protein WM294_005385 [Sarcoramphus papa]
MVRPVGRLFPIPLQPGPLSNLSLQAGGFTKGRSGFLSIPLPYQGKLAISPPRDASGSSFLQLSSPPAGLWQTSADFQTLRGCWDPSPTPLPSPTPAQLPEPTMNPQAVLGYVCLLCFSFVSTAKVSKSPEVPKEGPHSFLRQDWKSISTAWHKNVTSRRQSDAGHKHPCESRSSLGQRTLAASTYLQHLRLSLGNPQPLSFQPGTLYQYRYSLDVQLDHVSTPSPRGAWLRAEALVQLHRLWRDRGGEELLQVQIRDLKAQRELEEERSQDGTGGPPPEIALSQEARAELQQPVFISWSSGKVKAFYGDEAESILISNLKRGVVSLLQLQPHAGTAVEEDVSGSCQVTYAVSNRSITKTKDLLSCAKPNPGFASVGFESHSQLASAFCTSLGWDSSSQTHTQTNPAWEGGETEMFSGPQTHRIGDQFIPAMIKIDGVFKYMYCTEFNINMDITAQRAPGLWQGFHTWQSNSECSYNKSFLGDIIIANAICCQTICTWFSSSPSPRPATCTPSCSDNISRCDRRSPRRGWETRQSFLFRLENVLADARQDDAGFGIEGRTSSHTMQLCWGSYGARVTPPCNERESPHGVTSPSPHISHRREHLLTMVLAWCCLLPHLGRVCGLESSFAANGEERNLLGRGEERRGCIFSPCFAFFKIFGVEWQPTSKSQYMVKDNLLQSVLSEESHMVSPALRSTTGIKISSRQQLQLVSPPMPGPTEVAGQSLEDALAGTEGRHQPLGMASLPFKRVCTRCPSLRAYLKAFDGQRVKMDTSKAATTWQFQRFIQMLRSAKKRDVLELLRRAPEEMLPFVVETAVAAQSVASLAALSDFLDFGKEPKSLLEKFLYAAAFSPRPSGELLHLVLDKLDGKQLAPEVRETGIVALGSLVGKLCQQKLCGLQVGPLQTSMLGFFGRPPPPGVPKMSPPLILLLFCPPANPEQEVARGVETILAGLRGAEEESEAVIYLLALGNAVLPETIPTLLDHAEEGPAAVATAAISALRRFPARHISSKVKRAMRRIFHEKRKSYEKTCRLAAAEILLDNEPSPMDVINILLAASELETETATFLLLKVQNSLHADHHHPARKIMKDIMGDPRINNYNFFSKAGISSSFSGPLTVTQDLLSTFELDLLFLEGGFLRKSVSDFSLFSRGRRLRAAQVTIEAQGMESMLGENVSEGEEEPELMAGMSAIFFDVQLRPIIFFQGYTDLMAKVLLSSGEPTSVVKGNLLLMDHHQVIPLQSGLQVAVKLQGGLGLDISADMDVSIWEQDLKTSINARGNLAIDFQAELDAPFLQATLRSQMEVETSIHFDTMLRFSSSPVLMCLQLREEQVPYREIFTVSKSARSQSSTARKGRQGTVPGREFALHRANSKVCNLLLTAEEE